jgi:ribosomal protein L36
MYNWLINYFQLLVNDLKQKQDKYNIVKREQESRIINTSLLHFYYVIEWNIRHERRLHVGSYYISEF